jgi:hypothetical protein
MSELSAEGEHDVGRERHRHEEEREGAGEGPARDVPVEAAEIAEAFLAVEASS